VIVSPGLNTATPEELCRVIVFLWLSTSTPERLLQSDCQPWAHHSRGIVQSHCFPVAQHFNSGEVIAE
jgi:hypothetical protein